MIEDGALCMRILSVYVAMVLAVCGIWMAIAVSSSSEQAGVMTIDCGVKQLDG